MTEMNDYSGEFKSILTFEDLSKNALIKMLKEICMLYLFMSESWAAVVKERHGEKVSFEMDMENWRRMGPYASQRLREAMNIKGNDVETWFKALQVDPGWGPQVLYHYTMELKNKNHGIFTVHRCIPLELLETAGEAEVIKICREMEEPLFNNTARSINPKMVGRPLKLPPRASKDEIACVWEFKIEE